MLGFIKVIAEMMTASKHFLLNLPRYMTYILFVMVYVPIMVPIALIFLVHDLGKDMAGETRELFLDKLYDRMLDLYTEISDKILGDY